MIRLLLGAATLVAAACVSEASPEPSLVTVEEMISAELPAALAGARHGRECPEEPGTGNAVTDWNAVALEVLPVDPGLVQDSRGFAILHASIHDAVNGIDRRYEPYTADLSAPGASAFAAVASAAREVLVAMSPTQAAIIEGAYAAALDAIPDGAAKEAGIAVGRQGALANLMIRVDDGSDEATEPVYVPTGQPGDYDFTPPFDAPPNGPLAVLPGWGRVAPFAVEPDQHELAGPDPVGSLPYALDVNYLTGIGRLESRSRTDEQTESALFWFEFSPIGWNRLASIVVRQRGQDLWQSARVLALVNLALADGYIAGFAEKYRFRFWRPYTAIRRAGDDGNPFTSADETWQPLLSMPPFFIPPVPDYPSTHTVLGAAAAEVLIRNFGDRVSFPMTSGTLPDVTRCYHSFTEAAVDNGLSRIYGGIHFVRAVLDGYKQGRGIGRSVSRLLPAIER